MKLTFLLSSLFLLMNLSILSQNIDKLNKKKLRVFAKQQVKKIDSIQKLLLNSRNDITALEINLKDLRTQLSFQKSRVASKDESLEIIKNENTSLAEKLIRLQEENKTLVKSLQTSNVKAVNNFLTQFLINQQPIENKKFHFVLDKILVGSKNPVYDDYYNRLKNTDAIPEYVSVNDLSFYSIIPNKKILSKTTFQDVLKYESTDAFNMLMPSMEIIKNKFVTMTYFDKQKESFLLSIDKENNNKRNFIKLKLEGEEAETYRENSKDVALSVFAIGNQAYVALNVYQLKRLLVSIKDPTKDPIFKKTYNYRRSQKKYIDTLKSTSFKYVKKRIKSQQNSTTNYTYHTIGEDKIYIARKGDEFLKKESFLNLNDDLVFLFKLELAQ